MTRYVPGWVLVCLLWPGFADAGPAIPPTPLPPPTGAIVHVSTVSQLQNAVAAIASNTTIMIAPGTYQLTSTLYINGNFTNVGVRGATANRDDVVIVGRGMNASSNGGVPFGIWVGGNVRGVTIANLTIRDVYNHPIILNAGAQSPYIHNVRLVNAGQQFLKANPDGTGGGVDNGIVEYSVFEYDTVSRDYYTNGVDVHTGDNWIIRHNLFRRMRAPAGQLAGPAILMWNNSTNTLVDGNTFIECQREIALGLIERTPNDHTGGVVRNNFIYRSLPGDVCDLRWRLTWNPGAAQQHPDLADLRQPDRVSISAHDGRGDRQQRRRRQHRGTQRCHGICRRQLHECDRWLLRQPRARRLAPYSDRDRPLEPGDRRLGRCATGLGRTATSGRFGRHRRRRTHGAAGRCQERADRPRLLIAWGLAEPRERRQNVNRAPT